MTTYEIVLIGFGNVGRRFAALLDEKRPALRQRGVATRIAGIVTRHHDCAWNGRAVPFRGVQRLMQIAHEVNEKLQRLDSQLWTRFRIF